MEVHLTPDQQAFSQRGIAAGRYQSAEEAVKKALARWEYAERTRADLLLALDEAEADVDAGRCNDYAQDSLPKLSEDLKREARASRARRRP